jgi:hypothetical protein
VVKQRCMKSPSPGERGSFIRADGVENLTCSLLDVLRAFGEELEMAVVKLDVILSR